MQLCGWGFSHIVVGTVDPFALVSAGRATLSDYALRFAAATLLGDLIGGVSLVAALNHAQVLPQQGRQLAKKRA